MRSRTDDVCKTLRKNISQFVKEKLLKLNNVKLLVESNLFRVSIGECDQILKSKESLTSLSIRNCIVGKPSEYFKNFPNLNLLDITNIYDEETLRLDFRSLKAFNTENRTS